MDDILLDNFYFNTTDRNGKHNLSCTRLCHANGMDDLSTIGKRVRFARKSLGLTQQQLADKAGVRQQTVSQLERGVNASSTSLVAIARALDVTPEWLESGTGPMHPPRWEQLADLSKLPPAAAAATRNFLALLEAGGHVTVEDVIALLSGTVNPPHP